MKIKHSVTKQTQTVTAEVWDEMLTKGISRKYTIVSNEPNAVAAITPKDLEDTDYKTHLSAATRARRKGDVDTAIREYEAAYAIKPLSFISSHVTLLKTKREDQ
jgi:hypothetical protein